MIIFFHQDLGKCCRFLIGGSLEKSLENEESKLYEASQHVNILVDVLLSCLMIPCSLMRMLVTRVFTSFARDMDLSAVELILSVS